jgi:hypothetical protein
MRIEIREWWIYDRGTCESISRVREPQLVLPIGVNLGQYPFTNTASHFRWLNT